MQQREGVGVGAGHLPQVEDHGVGVLRTRLVERVQHTLGRGEVEGALGGDDTHAFVERAGEPAGRGGGEHVGGGDQRDGGAGKCRVLHEVEPETFRERAERRVAAYRGARRVQERAVGGQAETGRPGGEQTAGDAALGGQTDPEQPVAGGVVHSAGRHDGEDLGGDLGGDDPLPGDRIDTAVGQGRGHHGEVDGRGPYRALPEVGVHGRHRVDGQGSRTADQIGERPVAVPGRRLGAVDVLVDVQLPPGEPAQTGQDAAERGLLTAVGDQSGGHDGAGVDHRIGRPPGAGLQADGVERLAARFGAHPAAHLVEAERGQREGVDEGLGHRLQGEGGVRRAGAVGVPVHTHQGEPEVVGVRPGQLRDVVGLSTLPHTGEARVELAQRVRHGFRGAHRRPAGYRAGPAWSSPSPVIPPRRRRSGAASPHAPCRGCCAAVRLRRRAATR